MKKLTLYCFAAAFTSLAAAHAHAQADLTFSGGMGGPLTIELDQPVTYSVTTASTSAAPFFAIESVGNVFSKDFNSTGTLAYTLNAGTPESIGFSRSGYSSNAEVPADLLLSDIHSLSGVAVGNTVVLQAGSLTTSYNFAGAPPANGSYATFLSDDYGNQLSAVQGVAAAPEPSAWALLGVGAVGMGLITWHRRRACA